MTDDITAENTLLLSEQNSYNLSTGEATICLLNTSSNLIDLLQLISLPMIWYNAATQERKNRRMSMDWVPWVIRAILIGVGITTAIMVSKRKKEGIYQGQYCIGILVIGITAQERRN